VSSWETALIWGALAAFVVAAGARFWGTGPAAARAGRTGQRAFALGVGLLVAALVLLAAYFLTSHLGIAYVHAYTRTDYPWYYKLTGLWAGNEGTLLMWAAFFAAFAWAADRLVRRAAPRAADPAKVDRLRWDMQAVSAGLLAGFTGVLLVAGVFEVTPAYLRGVRPLGNGLQPVLLTPFMIIHPPLQFFAYGLTGVLFAGGLVNVATGSRLWAAAVRPWARIAWLFSTFGLGLGGLWAYYVLNFGGFWAWDPVETANLIAWFPLTILLHTLLYYDKGRFPTAAPLFALLSLPAALFATVATRTGLWVSVHAFTDPSKNFARDPFQRMLFILETSTLLQVLTALFFASLLVALAAVAVGRVRGWPAARRSRAHVAIAASAAVAIFLLFVSTVSTLSVVFQVAYMLTLARSTLVGFLVLVGAVGLWVAVGGRPTPEPPRPRRRQDAVAGAVNVRNVFAVAVVLLALAFLVTFLLNMMAVNGYTRVPFDERAPWVALPILLAMGLLFLLPWLGPRRGLAAALGALALGVAGVFMVPEHWEVVLVAPAFVLAGTGAVWRSVRSARKAGRAGGRSVALGGVLVAGALLGIVYWSNPPSTFWLLGYSMPLAWGWAVPGYAAAFGALAAGMLLFARDDRRVGLVGGVLLLVAFGYGVSALAGLAVLIASSGLGRPEGAFAPWVRSVRERLRKSAVFMLHVMLIVGLSGYAAATYESEEAEVPLEVTDQQPGGAFADYTFQVAGVERFEPDPVDGTPEEFRVTLRVFDGGSELAPTTLVFWKVPDDVRWHYDARTTVVRYVDRDLYLFPTLLVFEDGELVDHSEGKFPPQGDVVGLRMTAKILPGMALVWTGLWTITGLMVVNVALAGVVVRWPVGSSAPASSSVVDEDGRERVPAGAAWP
jgi:cytochrome c-type biogenesis protein CcmF